MKSPKTLIREWEGANPPVLNSVRTYSFVRARKNGEANIEIWAAKNSKRKGKPLMCKKVWVFHTDSDRYELRDTIEYTSWSQCAHDHLIYNFPEAGGHDYFAHELGRPEDKGVWDYNFVSKNRMLPIYAKVLNDWSGTKYKYCGYDHNCGMPVIKYLALWKEFPQAEILSKARCFHLLERKFLARLRDNREFARFVGKNHHGITEHLFSPHQIWTAFRRGESLNQLAERLAAEARVRREAAKRAEEARKLAEEAEIRKLSRENNERIFALYERLKSICGHYGVYDVVCPKNSDEMMDEGIAMHNCIGRCYSSMQGKEYACLFLRKDGKPCVDIRIDLKTFKVCECRLVCNKDAEEDAWEVARAVAERMREVA